MGMFRAELSSGWMAKTYWSITVYDRRCLHNFEAEGMEEIEAHNMWEGFKQKGEDEDGEPIYQDQIKTDKGLTNMTVDGAPTWLSLVNSSKLTTSNETSNLLTRLKKGERLYRDPRGVWMHFSSL